MKLSRFFLLLILYASSLSAAFDYPAHSARHAALSGSYVAATNGRDGFLLNPALSASGRGWYTALSYARLYNLAELGYGNGVVLFPYGEWGMGLALDYLGGSLYSETRATVNASRQFLQGRLSMGISLHAFQLSASNYDGHSTWGLSVGVQYEAMPGLHIAAALENINRPSLRGATEELPQTVRMGLMYRPLRAIAAYMSVQKDSWFPAELAVGVEYRLSDAVRFQSGYSTRADVPSGGLALSVGKVEIGYALQYHFDLGETHFFSVAFYK